jgi:hypothetical protein
LPRGTEENHKNLRIVNISAESSTEHPYFSNNLLGELVVFHFQLKQFLIFIHNFRKGEFIVGIMNFMVLKGEILQPERMQAGTH